MCQDTSFAFWNSNCTVNLHMYTVCRTTCNFDNEQTKVRSNLHYLLTCIYSMLYEFTIAAAMSSGDNQGAKQKKDEENYTNQEMQRSSEFAVHCSNIYALICNVL